MIKQDEVIIARRVDSTENDKYCAFVIDNEVVRVCGIRENFYNLIKANYLVTENINVINCIDFINSDNDVVETLECDEELSAILRSSPSIYIIFEGLGPDSIEELGWKRYISAGWVVSESGEFDVYPGWTGDIIPNLPQRLA